MTTDTLNRRLRFAPPDPQVNRLMLTNPDILMFEAINRHGPLPSHYLYEFTKHLRRDKSHLLNRLTEFYNGDAGGQFLTRPPQQFAGFEARYQHMVYGLAPRAEAFVERHPSRRDPFLHQLMTACVGASFELTAKEKGLRYISRDKILARPKCGDAKDAPNPMALPLPGIGKNASLIPDDLFGLEGQDEQGAWYRFFAVEIDRNTESIERRNLEQTAFGRKVANYVTVLQNRLFNSWWGIPNLTVLTVTTNATHAINILDHIKKNAPPKQAERFLIQTETDFAANWRVPKTVLTRLLGEPWNTPTGTKDISRP